MIVTCCVYLLRPTTMSNLLKVEDMAVEKAQRYGKQFTDLIQDFCQSEKLSTDKMPDDAVISARVSIGTVKACVNVVN